MTTSALPIEDPPRPNAAGPDEARQAYFYQWEPVSSLPGLSLEESSRAIEWRVYVPKK